MVALLFIIMDFMASTYSQLVPCTVTSTSTASWCPLSIVFLSIQQKHPKRERARTENTGSKATSIGELNNRKNPVNYSKECIFHREKEMLVLLKATGN